MEQPQDDGFKWFGEGFDGFPKRLPDDTVEYSIFLLDSALSPSAHREQLKNIHTAATALTRRLLKGFIWQRESFNLSTASEDGLTFLRGQTNYGDSVSDEWLIVYILRELSTQFTKLWIKITDTDGEFLLIEAANALPKWLNPEVADNRVWLNDGSLLIIPPSIPSSTKTQLQPSKQPLSKPSKSQTNLPPGPLSLTTALSTIQASPRNTLLHARLVEEEAFHRLQSYPQQITLSQHNTLLLIPRRLAFLLHANPSYISPAVEAFYLRDPISLKPLHTSVEPNSPPLLIPPTDQVLAKVRFPRAAFAQVHAQNFSAPGLWADVLLNSTGERQRRRCELGMKVACGMEMLLRDPGKRDDKAVREILMLLGDLDAGEEKLPSDEEVCSWGTDEDLEDWLDVDFRDLEEELQGKGKKERGDVGAGFGDKGVQQGLRRMVKQFEDFLNEDGDGMDDMDEDDDDDSEDEDDDSEKGEDDGAEDKDASFDEDEFTAMMREMMGLPRDVMQELMGPQAAKAEGVARPDGTTDPKIEGMQEKVIPGMDESSGAQATPTSGTQATPSAVPDKPVFGPERPPHLQPDTAQLGGQKPKPGAEESEDEDIELIPRPDLDPSDEEDEPDTDEEQQIRELSAAFEAELKQAGALALDDPMASKAKDKHKAKTRGKDKGKKKVTAVESRAGQAAAGDDGKGREAEDSDEELLDEDYNLVSNMLESFKSQGGLSGPGGNILGMMGVKLPRDELDSEEEDGEEEGEGGGLAGRSRR